METEGTIGLIQMLPLLVWKWLLGSSQWCVCKYRVAQTTGQHCSAIAKTSLVINTFLATNTNHNTIPAAMEITAHSPNHYNRLSGSYISYSHSSDQQGQSVWSQIKHSQSAVQKESCLHLQAPVVMFIIPWLWSESNYRKPLAVVQYRVVLLHHHRLGMLNAVTEQYSNGIPKCVLCCPCSPQTLPSAVWEKKERTQPQCQHSPRVMTQIWLLYLACKTKLAHSWDICFITVLCRKGC